MLKDVSFGQYYPVESFVHKMDPRMKIILTIAYIVLIFLIQNFTGFIYVAVFLLVAILFSRVRITSVLRSIRPVLFLIVIMGALNLFLSPKGNLIGEWWIFKIYDESLRFAIFMTLRLLFLITGSTLLTLTTPPVSLTDGIESLLKPLKVIKFPVSELALIMSIALRFIPTLMDETDRIMKAQKARGANFDSGNIFKRAKAMVSIMLPLLISAFRRADELADAMDARCYGGSKGRTKMKKLKFGFRDLMAFILMVGCFFLVLSNNLLFLI